MKGTNFLKMLLLLAIMFAFAQTGTFKGRALSQTCCNACTESRMMKMIFAPNRVVNSVFMYTQRKLPAMFFASLFKYSPPDFTRSVVEIMEELKWSKGENMVKCRGEKINIHGGYFKDFSNTTINVLF